MSLVTIFGYGSLMNQYSASVTMPSACNFRAAVLHDYARVFSLVSLSGIRTGKVNLDTKEVAALAIRPVADSCVKGCLFDVPEAQLEEYMMREHRYKAIKISANILDTTSNTYSTTTDAWTVVEQTDDDYLKKLGGLDEWHRVVGQYYDGSLWERKDILPMRHYLIMCLKATYDLGGEIWLRNFLDEGYLADGSTTIRTYLLSNQDIYSEIVYSNSPYL